MNTDFSDPADSGATLSQINNNFGLQLLRVLMANDRGQNIFFSPYSVATALQMAYNGAATSTKAAMAQTLGVEQVELEAVNQNANALRSALLAEQSGAEFTVANSLWIRQGFDPLPAFVQNGRDFYAAEVATLDFADPTSLETINGWVAETTGGKIEQLVEKISPLSVLFLLNAVHFKGTWQEQFDPAQTEQAPFTLADGAQKQIPMMSLKSEFVYAETEEYQAISLPYVGDATCMIVLLPRAENALGVLDAERWQQTTTLLKLIRPGKGTIKMPRFVVDYSVELLDALRTLGMGDAFVEGVADFSNLCDEAVYISSIKHKAVLEVNEEGAEAAAATKVAFSARSVPREFQMTVDRPFFCAIQDKESGSLLFMGQIADPDIAE